MPDPALWSLGANADTRQRIYVHPRRFERHPHIAFWGAPGVGKTIKMLQMIDQGLRIPRAPWIICNIKGGFGHRVRDLAIARGHAHRLEILDPSDPEYCGVYSPTHPNSLGWATHAKQLREGIREATNMSSFDIAQQMARVLFMFLALTRLFDLTFADTVALMRPKSKLRKQLLPKVPDPELKAALVYFDSLPDRRQDEIATSAMARLESFAFDPTLKAITCQKGPSIDMGDVIDQGKVFIADAREYDPLRVDDARLLLRFIVNDVVAHVFARLRTCTEPTPVYLVMDEASEYMTSDLCRALNMGREPGLHVWLAAQFPDQFVLEDGSPRIRDAVMGSIENHFVFRLANVAACKAMAEQIFFDRLSTKLLKHELTGLEQEMVEEERTTCTSSRGGAQGTGVAYPASSSVAESDSSTVAEGSAIGVSAQKTRGTFAARGHATTDVDSATQGSSSGGALTSMESVTSMQGSGDAAGTLDAHSMGSTAAEHSGAAALWEGPVPIGMPQGVVTSSGAMAGSAVNEVRAESSVQNRFSGDGQTSGSAATESWVRSDAVGRASAVTDSDVEGEMAGRGEGVSMARTRLRAATAGTIVTETAGVTPSEHEEASWSESTTTGPMLIPHTRRVPISQTFYTEMEQVLMYGQLIHTLPDQVAFMKLEGASAVPDASDPWVETAITDAERRAALSPMRARPWYHRQQDPREEGAERATEAEDATRRHAGTIIAMSAAQSRSGDEKTTPPPPPNIWVRVDPQPGD